jgi:hypothetical protein
MRAGKSGGDFPHFAGGKRNRFRAAGRRKMAGKRLRQGANGNMRIPARPSGSDLGTVLSML